MQSTHTPPQEHANYYRRPTTASKLYSNNVMSIKTLLRLFIAIRDMSANSCFKSETVNNWHESNYTFLIGCTMWSCKVIFNRQRCLNEKVFPFGKVKRIAAREQMITVWMHCWICAIFIWNSRDRNIKHIKAWFPIPLQNFLSHEYWCNGRAWQYNQNLILCYKSVIFYYSNSNNLVIFSNYFSSNFYNYIFIVIL